MSSKLRLHQYLSKTGQFDSKKKIWDSLRDGHIKVDGEVIKHPQYQIKKSSEVLYKGKKLKLIADAKSTDESSELIYLLFNKPDGYLCSKLSVSDLRMTKKSIFSFIDSYKGLSNEIKKTLFCVGRLDEDTSGLLIITNDGNLSHKITSPDSNIEKKYLVNLRNVPDKNDVKKIEQGIEISLEENGKIYLYKTKPCKIDIFPDRLSLEITITEGKKREIRRIFEAIGNEVLMLRRISIGKLDLKSLNIDEGKFKLVSKDFMYDGIFK